jgi:ubiquinone/menaquinone biosynthesis C-methylase UbiE
MHSKTTNEINSGWETYYSTAGNIDLWKDDVEPFLLENYNLISQGRSIKILDIGCGDGRNSFIWIKNKHIVCCLDVAKSGLKKITQRCINMNITQPTLLCEDFLDTKLKSQDFDVVQCFDSLAQINDVKAALNKLCDLAKSGGYIMFNYFTPGDCAYGEGKKIDDRTFTYKDTLFKFLTEQEIAELLPNNVEIIIRETRRWDDPPHGEYRPYPHTHEAAFFLLRKK